MIPFLNIHKINKCHEEAFHQKMQNVMDKGWYILGKEVQTFEQNFAHYCGVNHCIGVANGLDALTLIFKGYIALNKLKKGDEVIVPSNTYIASILAIVEAGLMPVLVEPILETYTLNPDLIVAKITPKTKAILVVHLYGQLAEMDTINTIALQHDLLVVEDAAQSHGAVCQLGKAGNLGNAAGFSFYPGKNLGALGDGGAITTNDAALDRMVRSIANYGSEQKYHHDRLGVNSRLDELQAAFLNIKLPHLDTQNKCRQIAAKRYLSDINNKKIILPLWDFSNNHVFHLFVIRTQKREQLQQFLLDHNIQTMIHYPIPPHKQKAFQEWNNISFPITEKIHNEVLSLPISPVLSENELRFIINVLNRY